MTLFSRGPIVVQTQWKATKIQVNPNMDVFSHPCMESISTTTAVTPILELWAQTERTERRTEALRYVNYVNPYRDGQITNKVPLQGNGTRIMVRPNHSQN